MSKTKIIIITTAIVILLAGGILAYVFLIQPHYLLPKTDSNATPKEQKSEVAAQGLSLKNSISLDSKPQENAPELKPVETNKVSPNLESNPYISSKGKFQINAPKGWKVDESGQLGMDVILKSTKIDKVGSTPFTANITVDTEPTAGRDIRQCAETIKKGMPLLWPGYQLVEDRSISISGHPAIIISGKFAMKSQISKDSANARNLQLLVEDGKGTLFTGTATGLESTWTENKEILESSLLTLKMD
jgi:hypothetical protein